MYPYRHAKHDGRLRGGGGPGGRAEARKSQDPIAGTRGKSKDPIADTRVKAEMLAEKEIEFRALADKKMQTWRSI